MHMRHLETRPGRAQSQGFEAYPRAQGLDTRGPTQKRLGVGGAAFMEPGAATLLRSWDLSRSV